MLDNETHSPISTLPPSNPRSGPSQCIFPQRSAPIVNRTRVLEMNRTAPCCTRPNRSGTGQIELAAPGRIALHPAALRCTRPHCPAPARIALHPTGRFCVLPVFSHEVVLRRSFFDLDHRPLTNDPVQRPSDFSSFSSYLRSNFLLQTSCSTQVLTPVAKV